MTVFEPMYLKPKAIPGHQKIILAAVVCSLMIQLLYIYHIAVRNMYLPDDAYYYFSLGRNVAQGNGPKVDDFNITTGFQPLWGAICVLAFSLVVDKSVAVIDLQLVGLLAELLTVWLLYKWMTDLALPETAIVLIISWWLLSSQTMLNMLNGMETSLAILSTVAVYYSVKFKDGWLTGLLCGLAILARTDALILALSITLLWSYQRYFKQIMILWAGIVLTISPWIAFTLSIDKMPLPESGPAVRLITLFAKGLPYTATVESIWQNPIFHWEQGISFLNFLGWNTIALYPLTLFPDLSAILVCLVIILTIIYFRQTPTVMLFGVHVLGMIAAYSLFVGGHWFHFRYTTSLGLLLSALIIGILYQRLHSRRLQLVYAILISASLIVLHILFNPVLNLMLHRNNLSLTSTGDSFYEGTVWLSQNTSPTTIVGAFQTGIVGYYADFSVLNLDGKVNRSAYHALRDKTVWQYLCQTQVEYIIDWPRVIDTLLIKRSSAWQDDNLLPVKQISEVSIYAVNRANCSLPDTAGASTS